MLEELVQLLGSDCVKPKERMAAHTTFHIGGEAAYYVTPKTVELLLATLRCCREKQMPYGIVGNGSNLLASDGAIDKVIISTCRSYSAKNRPECRKGCLALSLNDIDLTAVYAAEEMTVCYPAGDAGEKAGQEKEVHLEAGAGDKVLLFAGAGVMLAAFARYAAELSLEGLAFAGGIPGTLGGAAAMNAGAYGGEIKDTIEGAFAADADGRVLYFTKEELKLSYRDSLVLQKGYMILAAVFALHKGNKESILADMKDYNNSRRQKQPLEYASAGSTFKRPEGYFAGKLIQDAGLKGYRVGDAMVSEKHSGFVVNVGKASAKDVLAVISHVQEEVRQKFGVELELEVKLLQ